ncbi:Short-chain dehydrogenase/reductase family 16C member 6-like protein [Leptotrombidium deliense]|uniref:Short-chain dehydrogenase/reductase 3 n=1 Tax=Leptotrombidium deliense TaxID=299467 RepID=A0A443SJ70_9ACAR|nr:Short-chain dehydrogenase/reductase family 16C member 6-like protein [Leptotrombidium deliense]
MKNTSIIKFCLFMFNVIYNCILGVILVFVPKRIRFKKVDNDIVLITGAGNGIGQRLALRFARLGSKVVIWDVNERGLRNTVSLVRKIVPEAKIFSFACDVSNFESVYETAKRVKREVGVVSMLINNAGIVTGKRLLSLQENEIKRTMDVNFLAHFWTCRAFLADMMSTNHGHIVSMGSIAGLTGSPLLTDYAASKYATIGFEESLRYELKADGYNGIHSTIVCPYFVNTGMFNGVRSDVLPFVDSDYLVDQIVSAILVNQEVLFVPRFMYFLYVLKSILPSRATYSLFQSLGGEYAMNTFVGRNRFAGNNGRGI